MMRCRLLVGWGILGLVSMGYSQTIPPGGVLSQIHGARIRIHHLQVEVVSEKLRDGEGRFHRAHVDVLASIAFQANRQLACNKQVSTYLTCHLKVEYQGDRGIR